MREFHLVTPVWGEDSRSRGRPRSALRRLRPGLGRLKARLLNLWARHMEGREL